MAHLKLIPPKNEDGSPVAAFGTKVVLINDNGDEFTLPNLVQATVVFNVDDLVTTNLTFYGVELPEELISAIGKTYTTEQEEILDASDLCD